MATIDVAVRRCAIKNAINTPAVNTTAVIGIVSARRALRITPPYADLPTLAEHR